MLNDNSEDYSIGYARLYDILTGHKDYVSEISRLCSILAAYGIEPGEEILSVGCGTGNHEVILDSKGYRVTGIDTSSSMIEVATTKSHKHSQFCCISISDFAQHRSGTGFSAAISLFNVVNCLSSVKELHGFLGSISKILVQGGLLCFESWNLLPCVNSPPSVVKRSYKSEQYPYHLERVATPTLSSKERKLTLDYVIAGFHEHHRVELGSRHCLHLFSQEEYQETLAETGFSNIQFSPALSEPEQDDINSDNCRMLLVTACKS